MGEGDYAIITGATLSRDGLDTIGSSIAKALAPKKHSLLIVARDEARLAALRAQLITLGSPQVDIVSTDLESPQSVDDIARAAKDYPAAQTTFFDNAGDFLADDYFFSLPEDAQARKSYLNLHGGTEITAALNPGKYVKTSSTAAYMSYENGTWYKMTKMLGEQFALKRRNMSEGLTWIVQPGNVVGPGTRARGLSDSDAMDSNYVGRWIATILRSPSFSSTIIPVLNRDTTRPPRDSDVTRRDILLDNLEFTKTSNEDLEWKYSVLSEHKVYSPLIEILKTRP